MNWKIWFIVFLLVLTGQGCIFHSGERVYKAAYEKLDNVSSYSCVTRIYVKGNKGPGRFKIKQWFCAPDRYRLEVMEPPTMQGKTTVYDGNDFWVHYPYINRTLLLRDIDSSMDENLFLGFFLRDMFKTEAIHYSLETWNKSSSLVITMPVHKGNRYRTTQKLILDKKNLKPIALRMYDIDGNVTVEAEFIEFQYNPELDDSLFLKGNDGPVSN